ncbi:MAG: hypothetical protein JWN44_1906 [Myxococcales bacterium]|nr:hypothetical protein [Myxococcales bacterium]
MELKVNESVAEFFQDLVAEAIRNQKVDTTTPTECYLVSLLSDFLKAPPDDEPLALKLAQAVNSPDERIRQLKDVGDTSLYVSGFFSDSLQRKLVDVDYYIQMGGAAYMELARYFRGNQHSIVFGEVYDELGNKFPRYVDVFAEVAEETMTGNHNLVQLYERWLRTGSEWMERRLRAQGVLPRKGELQ